MSAHNAKNLLLYSINAPNKLVCINIPYFSDSFKYINMKKLSLNKSSTFTSKFVTFLTKILFLPIYVSNEKVTYKLFHWRTLCHLIIYDILRGIAYWKFLSSKDIGNLLDTDKKRFVYCWSSILKTCILKLNNMRYVCYGLGKDTRPFFEHFWIKMFFAPRKAKKTLKNFQNLLRMKWKL